MATATDLSRRVNDISNRMNDVSERLSKFEGASSFLATKEDIALVKGDMKRFQQTLKGLSILCCGNYWGR